VALSKAERDRLDRLAGSGEGWGGGLPLPLLFDAIFSELLDEGSASTTRLIEIAKTKLDFKEAQIMGTWPTWDAFTQDVLDQLASRNLAAEVDGAWIPGPGFRTGEFLTVIPAEKFNGRTYPAHGVEVWPREEREARDQASRAESEAISLVARPNPISREVVARLRESRDHIGPVYPILKDGNGRTIDGHHREEADPSWPTETARRKDGRPIETDAEVLALIRDLDIRRPPMTAKTRAKIDKILGELAATNQVKRDRIEAELKRDASRSNHEISEAAGGGDDLVKEVRAKLSESDSIHFYVFGGGRGVRSGKHSADCWCGEGDTGTKATRTPKARTRAPAAKATPELEAEIERLRRAGEPISRRALAERFLGDPKAESVVQDADLRIRGALEGALEAEQRAAPAATTHPEPTSPQPAEHQTQPHVHDWVCRTCGERFRP
jgi:hypothetical protein